MTINFVKPAVSNLALVELLQKRSLEIEDPQDAVIKLQTVGYYRFSAYLKPFFKTNPSQNRFIKNISFNQIWDIYNFDSELRSLVYAGLEKKKN